MRVRANFNGLFGELLRLSHKDTCVDADGNLVSLQSGMVLTASDEDAAERKPGRPRGLRDCGAITCIAKLPWLAVGSQDWPKRRQARIGIAASPVANRQPTRKLVLDHLESRRLENSRLAETGRATFGTHWRIHRPAALVSQLGNTRDST
jgi:hypothetical protein